MQLLKGTSVGMTQLYRRRIDRESFARHVAGVFTQMIFVMGSIMTRTGNT